MLKSGQKITLYNKNTQRYKTGVICCFAESGYYYAITAYHVLDDMNADVFIETPQEVKRIGTVMYDLCVPVLDIGVIRLLKGINFETDIIGIHEAKHDEHLWYKCDVQEAVGRVTFNKGLVGIVPAEGTVELSVAGCSGAAWMYSELAGDKLAGLHTRGNNEDLFPKDEFARAVPAETLIEALTKKGLKILTKGKKEVQKMVDCKETGCDMLTAMNIKKGGLEVDIEGHMTLTAGMDAMSKVFKDLEGVKEGGGGFR